MKRLCKNYSGSERDLKAASEYTSEYTKAATAQLRQILRD